MTIPGGVVTGDRIAESKEALGKMAVKQHYSHEYAVQRKSEAPSAISPIFVTADTGSASGGKRFAFSYFLNKRKELLWKYPAYCKGSIQQAL